MTTNRFCACYININTVASMPCLQPGADEHLSFNALLQLLLLINSAKWCADDIDIAEMGTIAVTDKLITKVCGVMHTTERTFKKALKELVTANCIHKTAIKNTYYINPYLLSQGDPVNVRRYRRYCADNNIFLPPSLQGADITDAIVKSEIERIVEQDVDKERHSCLYFTPANTANYIGLTGTTKSIKKLNFTELITFLMLSTMSTFCKSPKSPELCNIVTLSGKEQERIAKKLCISTRSLRDALQNLTAAHLLHKVQGENGKYIINPFLAARGRPDKIAALQAELVAFNPQKPQFFGGFADGEIKSETTACGIINAIDTVTGEVIDTIIPQ